MSSIVLTFAAQVSVRYDLFYNNKKLNKNKDILLDDNSFLLLRERNIFSNKLVWIFCWIVMVFYWLYIYIITEDIEPKGVPASKEIQINYCKVLSEEIAITILKDKVEVTGLEIESIVIDGVKMDTDLDQVVGDTDLK